MNVFQLGFDFFSFLFYSLQVCVYQPFSTPVPNIRLVLFISTFSFSPSFFLFYGWRGAIGNELVEESEELIKINEKRA